MKVNTISNTFSYFGNFSKAINKENELKKALSDYQCHEGADTLPNGIQAKAYRFVRENFAITLRAFRLDIEYGYNSEECSIEKFMEYADQVAKILLTVDSFKGQRIAYSCVQFVENKDGKLVANCNKKFNVEGVFGATAQEFNLRVNHVHQIGNEEFNSIVVIQDGQVTNNATKERTSALFINKDINTLLNNTAERFTLADTQKYLGDMILEANDRTNTLLNAIGE